MSKTFTISVDVEDFFPNRNNSNSYFGKIKSSYWGITKIMDICEKFGCKITFFVDVDNTDDYVSMNTIITACKLIASRGHEVGLHTHPPKRNQSQFEKDRVMLNYDFDYQYDYIINNSKKIEKWVGSWPVSHRSGSYGANYDTVRALQKANILVDSSVFWDRRIFNFVPDNNYRNINPFKLENIVEVPVTSYYLNLGLNRTPIKLKINKKTDIEWSSTFEFNHFIKTINPSHVDVFMHSYSLIDVKKWQPNMSAVNNLFSFLKILREDYDNILFRDILEIKNFPKVTKPQISMDISKISLNDFKSIYYSKLNLNNFKSLI